MNKKEKLGEIMGDILLIALTLLTAASIICAKPQMIGANGAYMVMGGSMAPTFRAGDMILTVEPKDLKEGDIITFYANGKPVSHRIVAIRQDEEGHHYYWTKGDANKDMDRWVISKEDIAGKYWLRFPYLGYVVHFVKSKYFLLFAVLPIASWLIATRTWDTYEILTDRKTKSESTATLARRQYLWLRRLVEAYYLRGIWWRRVITSLWAAAKRGVKP